jgi:hypothetical protein
VYVIPYLRLGTAYRSHLQGSLIAQPSEGITTKRYVIKQKSAVLIQFEEERLKSRMQEFNTYYELYFIKRIYWLMY